MSAPTASLLTIENWGRTEYQAAWDRQKQLVERRIAGDVGDTMVFTEHPAVFTQGLRAGSAANLIWTPDQLAREGLTVIQTNRGGDITYHGPGQIVGYPIISLAAHKDLHAYLRFLEQVLIDALQKFRLTACRREGKTGIWVERRKIAAIGVAVRRWVTYHGFALNVDPQLRHFEGIIPCGIDAGEGSVTSMQVELGRAVDLEEVKRELAAEFASGLPKLLTPTAVG